MTKGDLKRLAALLRQERAALMRGDYARLDALVPRKTALLERLEKVAPPPVGQAGRQAMHALATEIRTNAERNARLFQAAIAGIRDARTLLARARDGGRGQTYGRNGARATLEPPAGSLHRRA